MYGKEIRMRHLCDCNSGKMIFVPMDHGATMGPIKGIEKIEETIKLLDPYHVNGIILCKGHLLNRNLLNSCNIPYILHLSNSIQIAQSPDYKILVGSVEQAIMLGAEAVSVQVNIGAINDTVMIRDFARISEACTRWGIPLLAMMYFRPNGGSGDKTVIKTIARFAQEMGADIVNVEYTGNIETFSEVVQGCSIPVIISGGEKDSPQRILQNAYEAIKCGAAGVAYGRNIFQAVNPQVLTYALSLIVHKGMEVNEVLEKINEIDE